MRKISLDLNALRVESFDTSGGDAKERGTVHGNSYVNSDQTCPCPNTYVTCETECGAYCPSGPAPGCDWSVAFTDGYAACMCGPNQSLDC